MRRNPSEKIREHRGDLSPYLFHYTKGRDSFEILLSIINDRKLKSDKGYICLTEAPITTSLGMFDYMNKFPSPMYAPYGIGFKRDFLFEVGARPVIYGTNEENEKIPEEFKWRCLNLKPASYDFSWLREWRIKGDEFDFKDYGENIIIIAPTEEELKRLITDYDFDVDFDYEHETRSARPYLVYHPKRGFRGISLEKIRDTKYSSDSDVSSEMEEQKLDDPLKD